MAEDEVLFVMHRRVVRHDSPGTKGIAGWAADFGETLDARVSFEAREADDHAAKEAARQREADIDAAVDRLRMKAAVDRRVAELRAQQGG